MSRNAAPSISKCSIRRSIHSTQSQLVEHIKSACNYATLRGIGRVLPVSQNPRWDLGWDSPEPGVPTTHTPQPQ